MGGRPSTIYYDPGLEDYLWRIGWRQAQIASKIAMQNSESDGDYDDLPNLL